MLRPVFLLLAFEMDVNRF
ncbi:Bgt-20566, partial [Blumeria graminis f. sp. tritici]